MNHTHIMFIRTLIIGGALAQGYYVLEEHPTLSRNKQLNDELVRIYETRNDLFVGWFVGVCDAFNICQGEDLPKEIRRAVIETFT